MSIPIPLKENVFLKLTKALNDELVTEGGLKLYLDATYNPEWNATVTGKVASLPKNISKKSEHILSQLYVGDEVCFSYAVVADVSFSSSGAMFERVTEDNPYRQQFKNGKGETINITALAGKISKKWVGTHHDKYGRFSGDGIEGTEGQMENWLSKFPMGKNQKMAYKNLIAHEKQNFWKVAATHVFAKKAGKEIIALGDRVICKPIEMDIPRLQMELKGIKMPNGNVKARFYDRAKVISGGKDMGLKKGSVISFEPHFVEKYKAWGEEYFIIKKSRILGKWA